MDFWETLDKLIVSGEVVIDRPKGSTHPKSPDFIFPLDHGYLKEIITSDGNEIDVWQGSMPEKQLVAIVCTVDTMKKDAEFKLIIGCTEEEMEIIREFYDNSMYGEGIIIRRKEFPQA